MASENSSSPLKNRRALLIAAAGGAGGAAGFVISRLTELWDPTTDIALSLTQGFWYASVVGAIGAAIAIAAFRLDGRRPSGAMAAIGSTILVAAGFVAGVVAQVTFTRILDDSALGSCFADYRRSGDDSALNWCVASVFRLPRFVGWAVAGSLGGIGIGAFLMSRKRGLNAVAGGALAGAVGGLIFDLIPAVTGISSLWPSQLIAVVAIGALIGLLVSVIESLRLSAWVEVLTGELKGRTIALTESVSRIGTERSFEIPVIGDRGVHGFHARILFAGDGASIEPVGGPVDVNGRTGPTRLVDGDVFTVGATSFRFRTKVASAASEQSPADGSRPPQQRPTTGPLSTAQSGGVVPPRQPTSSGPRERPRLDLKPRD